MSVVNEFSAKDVRFSADPKLVYILDELGNRSVFAFDIHCSIQPMSIQYHIFFNMSTKNVLITYKSRHGSGAMRHTCGLMKFWVENDSPVLSSQWFLNIDALIKLIQPSFSEQLASYVLDEIINSASEP